MKDKEKQIEEMRIQRKIEMTKDISNGISGVLAYEIQKLAEHLISLNYVKLPEDSVVLSREEYEEYQSFKNGDYCATKCDIHELSFNQMNKISDLENENEKLKKEIKNPNEVLEDRERFRARNEELKGITEQLRQEIITLSQELVNSRKETAEKILIKGKQLVEKWLSRDDEKVGLIFDFEEFIKKQFGVEIKE